MDSVCLTVRMKLKLRSPEIYEFHQTFLSITFQNHILDKQAVIFFFEVEMFDISEGGHVSGALDYGGGGGRSESGMGDERGEGTPVPLILT